ncbi:hypothetical protein COU20_02405 [Candidatus Kaiserbacteria bacterium CG10_big_fil_rev_8_21_14_0_10_59_10]|uniref:Glycosyl transferase family 1 domain-containing protein n=1 Tax=Candidatus Kaiserbacteria bacterium CG10_big_fil_rev_8_21_14_0_10_59_10 TaxID=1974612 RepID=A0A2H0U9L7_9BACT|nr:MAG: hypothetical protein COU20_02405 [Candidatus Kaiserbacteria bacterium CG10_big_fil_rev_8_21_14_0_10_59_10]
MRFLVATPFTDRSIEALSVYARGLTGGLESAGHTVDLVERNALERMLPSGLRHLMYGIRIIPRVLRSDVVFALDTWSVGFPAFVAARLCRKRFAVRIGGDFLWEIYVERTREPILLSEFYSAKRRFTIRERCTFRGIRSLVRGADALFFTTRFQREVWRDAYEFSDSRVHLLENYYPPKAAQRAPDGIVFVSAGRDMFLKNAGMVERVVARIAAKHSGVSLDARALPYSEHLKRLERSYAVILPAFSEICSNTAIEAVARGKPFIMARDTGTKERLGECGIFIDMRSEKELEGAVERMLEPGVYAKLQGACRAFSFEHSWEDMAREICTALRRT